MHLHLPFRCRTQKGYLPTLPDGIMFQAMMRFQHLLPIIGLIRYMAPRINSGGEWIIST